MIILKDDCYIAQAHNLRNYYGLILYRKNGQTYQVDSKQVVEVSKYIPAEGEPYEEELWVPPVASDEPCPSETEDTVPKPRETTKRSVRTSGLKGNPDKKGSLTIGFMQGGGSLIGADFEFLLGQSIMALQFGGGLTGYDVALNFHFQPTAHSHYLSLGFWNQGGDDLYAQHVGLIFGMRFFHWLNVQLGVGSTIEMSGRMRAELSKQGYDEVPPFIMLYSIGAYF